MTEHLESFKEAILAVGLTPPEHIEPGRFHRFPGFGKDKGNYAGWCKLFHDGQGGTFGDYSSDLSKSWQAKRDKPMTTDEWKEFQWQVAEARKQAERERQAAQAVAAEKAARIWKEAKPAKEGHPYLVRKGIKGHGIKQAEDGRLLVPLFDASGKLWSFQYIDANGSKRFFPDGKVAACYFAFGAKPESDGPVCIAEGYATAASVHEATGYPVAVAFNAGNLKAVAEAIRTKLPEARLILCADDDHGTEGNPGLTKAREAAQAVGGLVAVPDFDPERPEKATDFNDLHMLSGLAAVRTCIEAAHKVTHKVTEVTSKKSTCDQGESWPVPQEIGIKVAPEPYPIDALPETIRAAVEEVAGFVKAPVPLVVASALGVLSLACQAHVDVKRDERLSGPVGLFLLSIADSGERKSTCDGFFSKAIKDYEAEQAELAKPMLRDYRAAVDAWEAKRNGIKEKIRHLAKEGKPTGDLESILREMENSRPEPPRVPRLIYTDVTPEELARSLARQWPSGGVVSSEAGLVFGAHGMGKESIMRNLGLLNVLWDGGTLTVDRKSSESFRVSGARLTVALQIQEATLRSFFDRSGGLARGTGFLARFLVSWPESTQGFRLFTDAPTSWSRLSLFHRRIAAILDTPAPLNDNGSLSPAMMTMTQEAKEMWIAFHDAIESELRSGGELHDVRDVASKAADNAARLAALFQVFEDGMCGTVERDAFEGASRIVAWHLNEAKRFFGEVALPSELVDAARLDAWLIGRCRQEREAEVSKREALQYGPIRNDPALMAAIHTLEELDRVRFEKEGKRKVIKINQAVLAPTAATLATSATVAPCFAPNVANVATVAVANLEMAVA